MVFNKKIDGKSLMFILIGLYFLYNYFTKKAGIGWGVTLAIVGIVFVIAGLLGLPLGPPGWIWAGVIGGLGLLMLTSSGPALIAGQLAELPPLVWVGGIIAIILVMKGRKK